MSMARKIFVLGAVLVAALTIGLVTAHVTFAKGSSVPTAACTRTAAFTVTPSSACAVNLGDWVRQVQFYPATARSTAYCSTATGAISITRTPTGGAATTFSLPTPLSTSYADTGLTPGTTYAYTATGLALNGAVTNATPASITTAALPSAPMVSTVSAREQGGNMIVSMVPSAAVSVYGGYALTRVEGYTGTPQTLFDGNWSGASATYADNTYNPLAVNIYTVTFFESDANCGALRNVSSPATVTVPGVVTNLVASYSSSTGSKVNLSWTPGAGQTYADIYRQTGAGAWSLLTTVTGNTYADTSVAPGTSYAYKVMAAAKISGILGQAGFSSVATVAVPALPVPAPALNFTARVVYISTSTADIHFTWNNIHPGFAYKVELATSSMPSGFKTVANMGGSVATSVLANAYAYGVPVGGAAQFRVTTLGVLDSSPLVTVNLDTKTIVKGTAWTSVTGWISLSCETKGTDCTTNKYNVSIGADNEVRGAAWSAGLGWLSFNKADLVGCPTGACVAKLDPAKNMLVGWAKFIGTGQWLSLNSTPATVGTEAPAQTAAASDIWNTFVSAGNFGSPLGFVNKVSATLGVAINTLQAYAQGGPVTYGLTYAPATGLVGGQAWGGDVIGWTDFSGLSGAPAVPVVSNVTVSQGAMINPARTGGTFCDDDPYYAVNWTYANAGSATQKQVKITVYNASSGVPYATTTSTGYTRYNLFDPLSVVGKGKTFTVGVSAFDGTAWSAEVMSNATTTPNRYFPLVDFSWSPVPAKTAWPITFTGTSTLDRSGGTNPASGWTWAWTFPHSTSTDPTKPNATAIFDSNTASSTDVVTLTVTDPTGRCAYSQQVLGTTGAQPKKIRDIKER